MKLAFRTFASTLIIMNIILYFAFRSIKNYDTLPQQLLILFGIICVFVSFIPFKKKGSKYGY